MANTWLNNDGLYVKFGTAQATLSEAGEYHFDGPQHLFEIHIPDMTAIGSTQTILDDSFRIGKNWRIEQVDVITETACTGATAVLNVGIIRSDRTTAEAAAGFVSALPVASLTPAGKTTVLRAGDTDAGTEIGATLASTAAGGYVTADWDTAAFTAGAIKIRVYYSLVTA